MEPKLNGALLAALISRKRETQGLNLRDAAAEAGVGFSTLGRLERNDHTKPDIDTLERVAAWLGTNLSALFGHSEPVEAHLRAGKRLSSRTAEALRELIVHAREEFQRHPLPRGSTRKDENDFEDTVDEPAGFESKSRWEEMATGIRESLRLAEDEALEPFKIQLDRVKRVDGSDIKNVPQETKTHLFGPGSAEWSAATIPLKDKNLDWLIVLNDSHTKERQRATLMEEYCHVLLGHDMTQISAQEGVAFRDYRRGEEAEAYYVGAAILVPQKGLQHRLSSRHGADAIAKHYGVSRELVEFRIKRLGLWYAYQGGLSRTE
jgi:transcriptional regulator with XRE-family HTH domain